MTGLPDGYLDVPDGKIASVQTLLQMFAPPAPRAEPHGAAWTLARHDPPERERYLRIFRRVGERWLWFSRLEMSPDELRSLLAERAVRVYTLQRDGEDEGLLELDFRQPGECELRFFGLTEALIGTGAGRWLMNRALELAWAQPIERFWLHSCTLDHPSALQFYIRTGFVPYARQIEVADDPRLSGLVPRATAPNVPLIGRRPD
jgi:GNAT superfamily N-acetyltransferase